MDKNACVQFAHAARENERKQQNLAKELCRDLLKTYEGKRKNFINEGEDPDDTTMPCTNVAGSSVCEDVVSADVRAIWLDEQDGINVELGYYYHDGEIEQLYIEEDAEFDWFEMLIWVAV